jgi:hypothetical protein
MLKRPLPMSDSRKATLFSTYLILSSAAMMRAPKKLSDERLTQ